MEKTMIITLPDLRYIRLTCRECKTVVTLDMKEPADTAKKAGRFAPKACPGCQRDYDTGLVPAVNDLQQSYEAALAVNGFITFHGQSQGE